MRMVRGGGGWGIALACLFLLVFCGNARSQGLFRGPAYPRVANVYLHGAVDPASIPSLARWDALVLDSVWSREQLQQLRELNPGIRLYFYTCAYCMTVDPLPPDAWRRENYAYAQAHDLWWRNADGSIASDWPGVGLVNLTDRAAAGPEGPWRVWFANRVAGLVRAYPELDGVFLDNYWRGISWEQGKTIQVDSDCNPTHNPGGCDGVPDSAALVDTLWNHALRDFARDLRACFNVIDRERGFVRPLSIVANGASDYFSWLNGTMYEGFPRGVPADPGSPYRYRWNNAMQQAPGGYLVAPFSSRPVSVQIINSSWPGTWTEPERGAEFERYKRFTFVSALLGDGYYSLDAARGHGSLWWEPEYDGGGIGKGYLGYPRGPARRILVPTGEEIVMNGSFSGTHLPWSAATTECSGGYRLDVTAFHSAPCAARVEMSNAGPGASVRLYQEVTVLGGKTYTLRFWARADRPGELRLRMPSALCPNGQCLEDRRFWVKPNWQEFVTSIVATGSGRAALELALMSSGPDNTMWIDDVSMRMGESAVWRRDFDHGIVLLNYTQSSRQIDLEDVFYRLRVPGSPVWDGAAVTTETVPSSDARILLRKPGMTVLPDAKPSDGQGKTILRAANPFMPGGVLRFSPVRDERVRIIVYDVAGRRVRLLLDRHVQAGGEESVPWDGLDDRGRRVPAGVYLCRAEGSSYNESQKLTVLR